MYFRHWPESNATGEFTFSQCNKLHRIASSVAGKKKKGCGGNMSLSLRADTIFGTVARGMILAMVLGFVLFYILPPILARLFVRLGWL
jgi:uncharacterized protein YqhQ